MWPFKKTSKKNAVTLNELANMLANPDALRERRQQQRQNLTCQRCSSKNAKPIMYVPAADDKFVLLGKQLGQEVPQFDTKKFASEYHIVIGRPEIPHQWHCMDCNHEWNT